MDVRVRRIGDQFLFVVDNGERGEPVACAELAGPASANSVGPADMAAGVGLGRWRARDSESARHVGYGVVDLEVHLHDDLSVVQTRFMLSIVQLGTAAIMETSAGGAGAGAAKAVAERSAARRVAVNCILMCMV